MLSLQNKLNSLTLEIDTIETISTGSLVSLSFLSHLKESDEMICQVAFEYYVNLHCVEEYIDEHSADLHPNESLEQYADRNGVLFRMKKESKRKFMIFLKAKNDASGVINKLRTPWSSDIKIIKNSDSMPVSLLDSLLCKGNVVAKLKYRRDFTFKNFYGSCFEGIYYNLACCVTALHPFTRFEFLILMIICSLKSGSVFTFMCKSKLPSDFKDIIVKTMQGFAFSDLNDTNNLCSDSFLFMFPRSVLALKKFVQFDDHINFLCECILTKDDMMIGLYCDRIKVPDKIKFKELMKRVVLFGMDNTLSYLIDSDSFLGNLEDAKRCSTEKSIINSL